MQFFYLIEMGRCNRESLLGLTTTTVSLAKFSNDTVGDLSNDNCGTLDSVYSPLLLSSQIRYEDIFTSTKEHDKDKKLEVKDKVEEIEISNEEKTRPIVASIVDSSEFSAAKLGDSSKFSATGTFNLYSWRTGI